MAFKGITFAGQNVTPKNDGGLYNAHYGDGILWGCSMNISGDDLVIQSGEFIAGGRVCFVDGATNVDLSGRTLQTGYIQVIMNYDLSQGEGSQWYTSFVESATTTFPALTQDDINDTGTLYQLELAVVQISGGNLTSVYSTMKGSYLIAYDDITPSIEFYDPSGLTGTIYTSNVANNLRILNQYNGTINCGLDLYNNGAFVGFAEGNNISFRPNGRNSTMNQMYLDTSGQLHGGALLQENTHTASQSLTGYTWTSVAQLTLSAGVHIVTGHVSIYGVGTGSSAYAYAGIGTTSSDASTSTNAVMLNSTTTNLQPINTTRLLKLNASTTYYLWVVTQANTSCTNHNLYAVQIA